ncbi:MAG: GNAT family N-acetyltransferase [Myxococcales bacterium]|nr:GNAT family N-acetyltransferase [Myxococcales bacterium]
MWTLEQRREQALYGPLTLHLARPDTRVIDRRPSWYQIITPSSGESLNEVILSTLSADEADAVIARTVAQYDAHGVPFKWSVGYWSAPPDLAARLERAGFVGWDVRGMVCDPSALSLPFGAGITVEHVAADDTRGLDDFVETMASGWRVSPAELAPLRASLERALGQRPQRYLCQLARVDGEPAAVAGLVIAERSGYLTGAVVLDRFRGRGLYRALLGARLQSLRERGLSLAVTQAREATSAPILEHLGFETVFRSRCYRHIPG